jgi:hypothetical protein
MVIMIMMMNSDCIGRRHGDSLKYVGPDPFPSGQVEIAYEIRYQFCQVTNSYRILGHLFKF